MSLDYVPIRVGTLRPNVAVNFDLFILVGEKHIKYIHDGDPLEVERFEKLKTKNVKKLYIPMDAEEKYLAYLDGGLNQLVDSKVGLDERAVVAGDAMITEAENVERNLDTETGYNRVQERVGKVTEFLLSENGALKAMMQATGASADQFRHGANVANLSMALATRLKLTDKKEIMDVAVAGLVHDIGKTKLDIDHNEIFADLSDYRKQSYRKHPTASVDLLSDKRYVSARVLRLIMDHHEIGECIGYPEKKRLARLPLSQQILNLCNDFDRFAITKKLDPLNAMPQFVQERAQHFEMDHVAALNSLLQGK